MAANNKITDLFLKRTDDMSSSQDLPTVIAVNFTPSYCNNQGVATNDAAAATHIRLTLGVDAATIDTLKKLTDNTFVNDLASHIGDAKGALNKDNGNTALDPPLGLRGVNADGTSFSGGKKSKSKKHAKSKKHPKSKKRKSVRRR